MSSANDAEPAFPQGMAVGDLARMHGGLTKREWIAGQVLAGVAFDMLDAALEAKITSPQAEKMIAKAAVDLTDALIAELAKVSP